MNMQAMWTTDDYLSPSLETSCCTTRFSGQCARCFPEKFQHQVVRTTMGFPCVAGEWNPQPVREPTATSHVRRQLGEGGQAGAWASHRLHRGQWTVFMSITLGSVNGVHVRYIGVNEQGSCPLHWGQRTVSCPLHWGQWTGFMSNTLGSANGVHVHYIRVSEQCSCPLHWGQWTGFISITLRSENSFMPITLRSLNRIHVHYVGVSEQCSCPLHWGQWTGFISIILRSENSFMSITLGSVNRIHANYVGVSEQCSCPLYWGHWTMLMSITLHYMSVRACVRVCVSVRVCAYFHYQQLFSRSGMKGPTTFPTSRYVLLLSLPSDSAL